MTMQDWQSAEAIRQWWSSPLQSGITRPYTAETVLGLRDVFPESYAANQQAIKLRSIFNEHHKNKTASYTFSPTDNVTLQRMIEAGFDCAYVSGAMTSLCTVTDPGTDLADYTYDSVPHRVNLLNRAQLLQARMATVKGARNGPDLVLPLIADADSGHGMHSAIMKLVKLFVQSGTAGIHIDDLLAGTKRYDRKDNEGWVVVPTCEAVRRLTAAKLQLDIMGSEMVMIYRTDGAASNRLTSTVDPRDRPYILGATVEMPQDYASLRTSPERAQWKIEAKVAPLDDAFQAAHPDQYATFLQRTKNLNVTSAYRVAQKLCPEFYWCCDAARNYAGYYFWKGCIEASAARANACAHLVDMVWSNSVVHDTAASERFAQLVRKENPDKWLGHNITGAFPNDGSRDAEIASIPDKLSELGFVFQFMPAPGYASSGMGAEHLATVIKQKKLLGYLQEISRPAEKSPFGSVEFGHKKMALLTDSAAEAVGDGYC